MAQFTWRVFLMSESCVDRICGALLLRGISIEPYLTGGKTKNTLVCGKGTAEVSNILACHLDKTEKNLKDFKAELRALLIELQVPYYGFALCAFNSTSLSYDGGYFPAIIKAQEQSKTVLVV